MKMRRLGIPLAVVMALLALPACSLFTPQQRSAAMVAVQQEFESGHITAAQRDAAIEAIQSDEGFDWEGLGIAGVNILLAILGGVGVVRLQRGPPTQKVGLPAAKVKPA